MTPQLFEWLALAHVVWALGCIVLLLFYACCSYLDHEERRRSGWTRERDPRTWWGALEVPDMCYAPRGYGTAWHRADTMTRYCLPIPWNWPIGLLIGLYWLLVGGPPGLVRRCRWRYERLRDRGWPRRWQPRLGR